MQKRARGVWAVAGLSVGLAAGVAAGQCGPDEVFGPAAGFGAGDANLDTTAGDLNGDGAPDLVVSPFFADPDTISVLLNDGSGSFGAVMEFELLAGPARRAAIGDFNEDGHNDLVVVTGQVEVLLGDGDGNFGTPELHSFGSMYKDVEAVDVDGDGRLDFVAADREQEEVTIGYGDGNGGFSLDFIAAAGGPTGVEVRDFNNDGILDLATSLVFGAGAQVNLGEGGREFGDGENFGLGDPEDLTSGDFDGDGNVDLAAQNDNAGTFEVLYGEGDGTFSPVLTVEVPGQDPQAGFPVPLAIGAADLDADGRDDVVTANFGLNLAPGQGSSFGVALGEAGRTFAGPELYFVDPDGRSGDRLRSTAFADFDGDGRVDLAGAANETVFVLLNACEGGCAADLDGDGDADVSDFFTYLDLFAAGDGRADITGDGSVDVSDFFAYLDLFAAGC